jgi:hypothetical protein
MFKRGLLYGSVLIVTVVIPWLVSSGVNIKNWAASLSGSSGAQAAGLNPGEPVPFGAEASFAANQNGAQRGAVPGGPKLVGAPVSDLAEVLRFDVSPQWVMSRWSRISTVLADLELEGLRVPLVTGTTTDDLAGSLTYYFDKQHQVQRITFHGYTGDERKLAALVAQRYQLKPVQSLNAALYLAKWNGTPMSALRVALAPVVRADSPNTRLEVMLEINRPRAYYGLSPEFKELLEREQQVQRW